MTHPGPCVKGACLKRPRRGGSPRPIGHSCWAGPAQVRSKTAHLAHSPPPPVHFASPSWPLLLPPDSRAPPCPPLPLPLLLLAAGIFPHPHHLHRATPPRRRRHHPAPLPPPRRLPPPLLLITIGIAQPAPASSSLPRRLTASASPHAGQTGRVGVVPCRAGPPY